MIDSLDRVSRRVAYHSLTGSLAVGKTSLCSVSHNDQVVFLLANLRSSKTITCTLDSNNIELCTPLPRIFSSVPHGTATLMVCVLRYPLEKYQLPIKHSASNVSTINLLSNFVELLHIVWSFLTFQQIFAFNSVFTVIHSNVEFIGFIAEGISFPHAVTQPFCFVQNHCLYA